MTVREAGGASLLTYSLVISLVTLVAGEELQVNVKEFNHDTEEHNLIYIDVWTWSPFILLIQAENTFLNHCVRRLSPF